MMASQKSSGRPMMTVAQAPKVDGPKADAPQAAPVAQLIETAAVMAPESDEPPAKRAKSSLARTAARYGLDVDAAPRGKARTVAKNRRPARGEGLVHVGDGILAR